MKCYQHLCFVLIIIVFHAGTIDGEIHRAKATSHRARREQQRADVAASDLHRSLQSEMITEDGFSGANRSSEVWLYSLCGAVLVGLSGIFPLAVIPLETGAALKHGAGASRLKQMLSFAVGGLLGDVFLHLLPEAWRYQDPGPGGHGGVGIGLWVIAGILAFLIIEKTFGDDHEFDPLEDTCEEVEERQSDPRADKAGNGRDARADKAGKGRETKDQLHHNGYRQDANGHAGAAALKKRTTPVKNGQIRHLPQDSPPSPAETAAETKPPSTVERIKVSGYLNLMANCIDNFTHGLAVGGSFLVSTKVGVVTTAAILLHEIPHEVGDFAILLRSGFDRWHAAKAQLLTASGGVLGTIMALSADSAEAAGTKTAWILPFTSGGFLYIALVTVVPDLLQEKHGWESVKQVLCLCCGILAMVIVTLFCD